MDGRVRNATFVCPSAQARDAWVKVLRFLVLRLKPSPPLPPHPDQGAAAVAAAAAGDSSPRGPSGLSGLGNPSGGGGLGGGGGGRGGGGGTGGGGGGVDTLGSPFGVPAFGVERGAVGTLGGGTLGGGLGHPRAAAAAAASSSGLTPAVAAAMHLPSLGTPSLRYLVLSHRAWGLYSTWVHPTLLRKYKPGLFSKPSMNLALAALAALPMQLRPGAVDARPVRRPCAPAAATAVR